MKSRACRKKLIFLFLVLYFPGMTGRSFNLNGQPTGSGDEKVLVHLSKPFYVAGEMLKYRVYTFNNTTHERVLSSRILYFVLADYKGNAALQWRINLRKENIVGSYKLPAELPGGVYTLTAYTSRMRNYRDGNLNSQNIILSNLAQEFPDTLYIPVLAGKQAFGRFFREAGQDLTVETGSAYNAGDMAEAIISMNKGSAGDTASLSVSVFLSPPVSNAVMNDSLLQLKRNNTGNEDSASAVTGQVYPEENKSFMLSGTVKSRISNAPVSDGRIILAVADSLFPHIRYSRTDSTGKFVFFLDRWFDNRELILQNGGAAVEGGIVWDIDRKKPSIPGRPYVPYAVQKSEINSFTMLNESRLIESVYGNPDPAMQAGVLPPGTNYFGPPDMLVKPADYSDLVNLKEITENILPGVRFVGKSNTYALQIFNVKTGQWPESDMILLNGVPFYDMNFIATLGTKDISRIEVISRNYLLGDLTLEGLVSIYTHNHKIPESYLKNRSYIFQNTVAPSDKPAGHIVQGGSSAAVSHDPDFRTILLWDPDREITGSQKLVIRFPVSLLTGTYDIVVNGITHKGTVVSGKTSFEVK